MSIGVGEVMLDQPLYQHTQRAPLCLLLYALSGLLLFLSWKLQNAPPMSWIFLPFGLATLVLATSFHYLMVADQGDYLLVSFGPLPLFRRTVRYDEILSSGLDRTTLLEGWGIHRSLRGGWVWNIWGRDCVVLNLKSGTLRIGTDDALNLARFLQTRTTLSRRLGA